MPTGLLSLRSLAFMVLKVLCVLLGEKSHQQFYLRTLQATIMTSLVGCTHGCRDGIKAAGITNHFLIAFLAHSTGRNTGLVCKSGLNPTVGGFIGSRSRPIPIVLLLKGQEHLPSKDMHVNSSIGAGGHIVEEGLER